MFTGIIEEIGTIRSMDKGSSFSRIHIQAQTVLEGTKPGDSIAVNGVCLTVTKLGSQDFMADVMPETLLRSSLRELVPGSLVNLERAMAADGRFGGHIVSGHIDGTGTIAKITKDGNAIRYEITASPQILRGIVEKGSIAIDGISLTVTKAEKEWFEVSVIPHTLSQTILKKKQPNDIVNLENDIIGKYVERLLSFDRQDCTGQPKKMMLTKEYLIQAGF